MQSLRSAVGSLLGGGEDEAGPAISYEDALKLCTKLSKRVGLLEETCSTLKEKLAVAVAKEQQRQAGNVARGLCKECGQSPSPLAASSFASTAAVQRLSNEMAALERRLLLEQERAAELEALNQTNIDALAAANTKHAEEVRGLQLQLTSLQEELLHKGRELSELQAAFSAERLQQKHNEEEQSRLQWQERESHLQAQFEAEKGASQQQADALLAAAVQDASEATAAETKAAVAAEWSVKLQQAELQWQRQLQELTERQQAEAATAAGVLHQLKQAQEAERKDNQQALLSAQRKQEQELKSLREEIQALKRELETEKKRAVAGSTPVSAATAAAETLAAAPALTLAANPESSSSWQDVPLSPPHSRGVSSSAGTAAHPAGGSGSAAPAAFLASSAAGVRFSPGSSGPLSQQPSSSSMQGSKPSTAAEAKRAESSSTSSGSWRPAPLPFASGGSSAEVVSGEQLHAATPTFSSFSSSSTFSLSSASEQQLHLLLDGPEEALRMLKLSMQQEAFLKGTIRDLQSQLADLQLQLQEARRLCSDVRGVNVEYLRNIVFQYLLLLRGGPAGPAAAGSASGSGVAGSAGAAAPSSPSASDSSSYSAAASLFSSVSAIGSIFSASAPSSPLPAGRSATSSNTANFSSSSSQPPSSSAAAALLPVLVAALGMTAAQRQQLGVTSAAPAPRSSPAGAAAGPNRSGSSSSTSSAKNAFSPLMPAHIAGSTLRRLAAEQQQQQHQQQGAGLGSEPSAAYKAELLVENGLAIPPVPHAMTTSGSSSASPSSSTLAQSPAAHVVGKPVRIVDTDALVSARELFA